MSRRFARSQVLPSEELDFLRSLGLNSPEFFRRVSALFDVGWTLAAISHVGSVPYSRAAVQRWVREGSELFDVDVPMDVPIPTPTLLTPEGGYQRLTPVSPGVPSAVAVELASVAVDARDFRARMASSSRPAVASARFDELIRELYADHVSVTDIARAANVTHRAIRRRLGKFE